MAGRIEVRVTTSDPPTWSASRTDEDGRTTQAGEWTSREDAAAALDEAYPGDLVVFIEDPTVESPGAR